MAAGTERSVGEVLQDIVGNVEEIVRSEVRLAKAEVKQQVSATARALVSLLIGAVIGIYALGFLLLALVYGLALVIASWWIAALAVGAALVLISIAFFSIGRQRMRALDPVPERTVRSLKESVTWDSSRSR